MKTKQLTQRERKLLRAHWPEFDLKVTNKGVMAKRRGCDDDIQPELMMTTEQAKAIASLLAQGGMPNGR